MKLPEIQLHRSTKETLRKVAFHTVLWGTVGLILKFGVPAYRVNAVKDKLAEAEVLSMPAREAFAELACKKNKLPGPVPFNVDGGANEILGLKPWREITGEYVYGVITNTTKFWVNRYIIRVAVKGVPGITEPRGEKKTTDDGEIWYTAECESREISKWKIDVERSTVKDIYL